MAQKNILESVRKLPELMESFSGVPSHAPVMPGAMQFYHREKKTLKSSLPFLHNRHIMIAAIKGKSSVVVDDFVYQLNTGKGMLIFPGQKHHFAVSESDNFSWLFATFDIFAGKDELNVLRDRIFLVDKEGLGRLKDIVATYRRAWDGDQKSAREMVYKFGTFLNALCCAEHGDFEKIPYKIDYMDSKRAVVKNAHDYVLANLKKSIKARDIAKSLNISESHLRAVFRQRMRVSLGRFIRHTRMNKAASLLRSSDMNISLVALACGYGSVNAFGRIFRKESGMTPFEFRKKSRGDIAAPGM